ncbi:hypothetical protein CXB51_027779 [Gossypium anomalum]|uniref:Uncharacterized protein n=1 Tax=Gossypium anomalum TaxID=47600 RepID=A0A8J5YG24_9ROSI|nr:hypothetical protein CXB51_027779 [Gossypium anomalum]
MGQKLGCKPNATSGMCAAGHAKDTFLELKRKKIYRYLKKKLWLRKLVIQLRLMMTSLHLFPRMIVDMLYMTSILLLLTIAKRARFSSLHGPLHHLESVQKCSTPLQNTGLERNWMVSTMRFRQLTLQRWILKC